MDRSDEESPRVAASVAPPRCVGARGTSWGCTCRFCGDNTSHRAQECGRPFGRLVHRRHEQGGPLYSVAPRVAVDIASGAGPLVPCGASGLMPDTGEHQRLC